MQKKILDIGCGEYKTTGAVGLDIVPLAGVDIVHNLEVFPYPIEPNTFDEIYLNHVVEHVRDLPALMAEIHRIATPNATVSIRSPHYTSSSAYTDPTHVRYLSLMAFEYFCNPQMRRHMVSAGNFEQIRISVDFWRIHDKLNFIPAELIGIRWIAEKHPVFFERFLTFIFPVRQFTAYLKVLK